MARKEDSQRNKTTMAVKKNPDGENKPQVIKKKPRGGNSPVIGMNGYDLEPGDNTKYLQTPCT